MPLLDQMAASGHLSWFVGNFIDAYREDENESALWDVWIHRVWNKTFGEFKREQMHKARTNVKNEYIRNHPQEVAKTVEKSRSIIGLFNKPIEQK